LPSADTHKPLLLVDIDGVISLFGYGISVFDLNAVESNDVVPSEANYISIREQVALSKGTDPTAPTSPARKASGCGFWRVICRAPSLRKSR